MKSKRLNLAILIFLSLIVTLLPERGRAQYDMGDLDKTNSGDISVTLIPEVPGPNENVKITLISYTTDLNQAKITWKTNGKIALTGVGKKTFEVMSGGNGVNTNIEINIVLVDGGELTKTIQISPREMDMLWQALDSYTPPFYKGRALPGGEGIIKIVALPMLGGSSTVIAGSNLVFNWKRNSDSVQNLSGYGKSSFIFKNSYLSDTDTIEAMAYSTSWNAKKSITVGINPPQLVFYQKDPLSGILYNKALGSEFEMKKNEMTLIAEPYFISPNDKRSTDLEYSWQINEQSITSPVNKNELVVRVPEKSPGGIATIKLAIENTKKLLEDVKATLTINLPAN